MNNNRVTIMLALFIGSVLTVALLFQWLAPIQWKYPEKYSEAVSMIKTIEEFKARKGRYPIDAAEAGFVEKIRGPYYTLNKDNTYIVSFPGGSCFFCAQNYYSSTKTWVEHE